MPAAAAEAVPEAELLTLDGLADRIVTLTQMAPAAARRHA
jgi:hypothetical protein